MPHIDDDVNYNINNDVDSNEYDENDNNINKIINLVADSKEKFITTQQLLKLYNEMKPMEPDERMITYMLNPDRADVIVPAMELFLKVAEQTGSSKIYVPQTGLSDGMVRSLYKEYKSGLN